MAFSNYWLESIKFLNSVRGGGARNFGDRSEIPLFYSILRPPVFVEKLEVMLSALNWGPLGL
jgi:hypothetical protein